MAGPALQPCGSLSSAEIGARPIDLIVLCAALLLEALLGYPQALFRAITHPVVWIGALIAWLDRTFNTGPMRRARGIAALLIMLGLTVGSASILQYVLLATLPRLAALLVLAILASTLLAQRSLWEHVEAVASGLDTSLAAGRNAVSRIVGRNPQALDEAGVVRAAIESLAENFSDGIVAPSIWCAIFGLPGIVFYKSVNTADSMIGHRTPRHARFGWAAARLDDLINLPASRLAAFWLILAAALHGENTKAAIRAVHRDAGHHRSPNAGWPEAAMAGALCLRLAGPRVYGDTLVDDVWMGDGSNQAKPCDLRRALALYRTACALQILAVTLLAIVLRS